MKIFILEDDENRNRIFQNMFKKHDLIMTEFAIEAIKSIHIKKYDIIFLDHDLGGRQMVDSSYENTGYTVAKEIINSINKHTRVIIHSFNPVGAKNMNDILIHAERRPFGTFNESILKEKE